MGTNITGIGNANAIGFKSRVTGGKYAPPELKDALVGVWSAYGKSNDSTDRNIIKNKIKDRGGDFVISNAAFKLNSGFGKYSADFESFDWAVNISQKQHNKATISLNGRLCNHTAIEIDEMKVNIIGNVTELIYWYIANPDDTTRSEIRLTSGINTLPKSYAKDDGQTYNIGFAYISGDSEITIEQIPSFEGAFVTDGIDDLITSTKTVQEMLGGSTEFTAVSMIHLISPGQDVGGVAYTNYIRTSDNYWTTNRVSNTDKTGIYGYSFKQGTPTVINNVLGDKNDYTTEKSDITSGGSVSDLFRANFSVEGFEHVINGAVHASSVAWYWTIIANKVLTTDQINQVIAYFNLDRTLKPDILCNTIKQGITNENHAEFGDKLIDFSGNGRDIQLNNIAWKGDSGIGKYEVDFLDSSIWVSSNSTITSSKIDCKNAISHIMLLYYSVGGKEYPDIPSFKVIKTGADIDYSYIDETGFPRSVRIVDGVNVLPASHNTLYSGSGRFCGFGNPGIGNSVTITQIPSHAGGLCLDGVNDFGKVTGMPIYKDYTVVADYERLKINIGVDSDSSILSKSESVNLGAFMFNTISSSGDKVSYSFGRRNIINADDTIRKIFYQSKYINDGQDINIESRFVDSDKLWLGTYRDSDYRFIAAAIYSLMSFPYSMSEFLIERQLKKHKLGTLYPDMVEFRPVIKSNVLLDAKPTFVIRGTSTYLNAGDYVPENSQIWVNIKMNNIADRITKFTVNGKTIDIPENAYSEVTLQYGFPFVIDKSPQKISITIEQDENYVLFNPVINSNYDNYKLTFHLREYEKLINIGDYIPKGTYIRANLYLKNNIDELVTFTFNGVNIDYVKSSVSDLAYNIRQIYNYDSPQEVNITVDEYIRYEDIVQPYPVLLRFKDENGNEVSWGGKVKLGSSITRIGSFNDCNLLKGIYTVSNAKLNGSPLPSTPHVVERQMVFTCTATYLLDDNEPKCILSPKRLKLANSSYKYLGYIPDISGNGNNGVFNNFAFSGMSGADGYGTNLGNWNVNSSNYGKIKTRKINYLEYEVISESKYLLFYNIKVENETFIIYADIDTHISYLNDSEYEFLVNIPAKVPTKVICPKVGTILLISDEMPTIGNIITVQQEGLYDGSICFDGVDDFVTIPTTVGGKQVLMKVNWNSYIGRGILYDQRGYLNEFAIYNRDLDSSDNHVFAYQARNNGQTYIDGILNNNIDVSELRNITHNITITNELSAGVNTSSPVIGSNRLHNDFFANMALYDFMLFDNISTDDKIKELNEYVGIEGNYVQRPPYYWDAYGKTNLDEDKATIQQRGVAEGDYDITNYNHAYDKMSGYGGYNLGRFDKSWASSSSSNTSIKVVQRNPYDITLKKLGGNSDWEFNNTELKVISNPVSVKFKSNKNIRVTCDYHYYPVGGNSEGTPLGITSKDLIANKDAIITISPISQENIDKYNIDVNRGYYLIYFQLSSTLAVNEEVTIEMLPLYPNALLYDGVDDYSENISIPAFTDYTYIFKRTLLNKKYNSASVFKGSNQQSGGGAFICDYNSVEPELMIQGYSFGAGLYANSLNTNDIVYGTKNSVNGQTITSGNNADTEGLTIGKWRAYKQMVFYKLMLYPRTTDMLTINMIKNMMAEDGIIDIQGKLFTDKYTGDFNLDFNKDFLIGN